jgi:pyruvate dehydrogenase E2 component (dihydrolipoamide acetyltransferase)
LWDFQVERIIGIPSIYSKMVRFGVALLACLALHNEVSAFGVVKQPSMPIYGSSVSTTQLFAEGSEILMPALSSTMTEGKVVTWLKAEGDEIEAGEAIMVVESDKADMDVEAFEDGFLAKIIVGEGEMAPVGYAVALIAATEADIESVAAGGGAAPAPTAEAAAPSGGAPAAAGPPDVEFSQIDMPALSSTMKEGKVVSWLKAVGDSISAGEAIMVVESDKADMDVEAFEDGFLAAIIIEEGDSGTVGSPVALIATEEADIAVLQEYAASLSGAPAPASSAAAAEPVAAAAAPKKVSLSTASTGGRVLASPLAKKKAEELGIDISVIAGSGPAGRVTASDVENAASGAAPAAAAPAKKGAPAAPAKPAWTPAAGVVAATPMARVAAKKAKIDLATIQGTGQFGRVTLDDVDIATGKKEPERKKAASTGEAAAELPDGFVPFTGMQKAVSKNMMATLTVPAFLVSTDIQTDDFEALYQKLKPSGVSVSALLAKAVALAIEKHPIMNSAYSDQAGGGTIFKKDINIAMAVAINGGLITPTLMYANERPVADLAENWGELVGKAKAGTLSPAEYNTGTFTISNMGMFGVTNFGSLLPVGQGGILAIGATQEVIVPCNQAIMGMKKIRKMTITLTCDHRHIYGSDAALFLKTLKGIMENGLDKVGA